MCLLVGVDALSVVPGRFSASWVEPVKTEDKLSCSRTQLVAYNESRTIDPSTSNLTIVYLFVLMIYIPANTFQNISG